MKLKRTASKNVSRKKEKAEALISRQAPGMCFAFNSKVCPKLHKFVLIKKCKLRYAGLNGTVHTLTLPTPTSAKW